MVEWSGLSHANPGYDSEGGGEKEGITGRRGREWREKGSGEQRGGMRGIGEESRGKEKGKRREGRREENKGKGTGKGRKCDSINFYTPWRQSCVM